jgi:cytochrome c peroxidase
MLFVIGLIFSFANTSCNNSVSSKYPTLKQNVNDENERQKIKLGEQLFFDTRLSIDNSISCSSCHNPNLAFADTVSFSKGVNGNKSFRNSPTLLNVAFQPHFMFEAELKTLEMQVVVPLTDLNEMGFEKISELIDRLKRIPEYEQQALSVFGKPFDIWVLTRSLAAYQRSLVSWTSDFDAYYFENKPLSPSARNGYRIFSEKLYCTSCHPAPFFTTFELASNGVYDSLDYGRYRITGKEEDKGKVKIPTLKNITLTHPYMHNGSLHTLNDVLSYYANGGSNRPNQSPVIQPFELSEQEKEDLFAFFNSLTSKQ